MAIFFCVFLFRFTVFCATIQLMEREEDQTQFKSKVKRWLKTHQLDYSWMAEQCGVSEITVRNWMSQKNIPRLKEDLIERVMVQLPAPLEPKGLQMAGVEVQASLSLSIKLAPDVYRVLETKASQQGLDVGGFVAQAISDLVQEVPEPMSLLRSRKVIIPSSKGNTPK